MAGIGNALLARPMVRQLVAGLPGVGGGEVHLVSRNKAMLDVFAGCGAASSGLVSLKPTRLHAAASTMRGFRAEAVVLPFPANRWQYRVLARAAMPGRGARVVAHRYPVGRWSALGFLANDTVEAEEGLHDVEQNLNLLRAFGIEPVVEPPRLDVEPDVAAVRALELERPVVVHAGCGATVLAKAKRWPPARFAAVIGELRAAGNEVLLIEGPDEPGVAAEMNAHLDMPCPALPLTGTILESAAVLAACKLYVGTDSGLAHLAAAVGTPPVTIFTVADPARVCPFGYGDLVVRPTDYPGPFPDAPYPMAATRPKATYAEPYAIEYVTVGSVVAKALGALSRMARA